MAPNSIASYLLAFVLVAYNLAAYSAVLGIDFGTEYIKAALVKPGIPLEIVLTKDSRRKELSVVTFKSARTGPKSGVYPERLFGSDAAAISMRFPSDTYANLKPLLGIPFGGPAASQYAFRHPEMVMEASEHGTAAFRSKAFVDDVDLWTIEELIAMQLQAIQKNAEAMAGSTTSVKNVVLTVPPFYTVEEKRAIRLAAELAGLKVLALVTDGLAVGLNYATSRSFPSVSDGLKPEIHMVFDMGAGSTKASILSFQSRNIGTGKINKTVQEVKVLGVGWDRGLGGDELNNLIVNDMLEKFEDSPNGKNAGVTKDKVRSHGRAIALLSKEATRLRQILSANQQSASSFEGLYDDIDFKYSITRNSFEKLANAHLERVRDVVKQALEMAQLELSDLDSVILHGGASRTPFVQRQLEKFVGSEKIRSNVNSDEAAVFGAGFRAAQLSPSFRVKDIRISELGTYPVGIKWTGGNMRDHQQQVWAATSALGDPVKELTFDNHKDFVLEFYQAELGHPIKIIKKLTVMNLTDSVTSLKDQHTCTDQEIRLKSTMKLSEDNGEVQVTRMWVECETNAAPKDSLIKGVKNLFGFGKQKDDDQHVLEAASRSVSAHKSEKSSIASPPTSASSASSASHGKDLPETTPKKQMIQSGVAYELVDSGSPVINPVKLVAMKDRLKAFANSDKQRKLREETLNELEGFTYKVRDLLENSNFIAASTEEERQSLNDKTNEASEWLNSDGVDASRDDLKNRLKDLHDIATPIQSRAKENEERPALVSTLQDSLKRSAEFLDTIKDGIAKRQAWESSRSADTLTTSSTASDASSAASLAKPPAAPPEETSDSSSTAAESAASGRKQLPKGGVNGALSPDIPPAFYTEQDLDQMQETHSSISSWLEQKVKSQEALGATDNPVLLVRDIKLKKQELDKVGMEIAMRTIKKSKAAREKAEADRKERERSEKMGAKKLREELVKREKEAKAASGAASNHESQIESDIEPTTGMEGDEGPDPETPAPSPGNTEAIESIVPVASTTAGTEVESEEMDNLESATTAPAEALEHEHDEL